MMLPPPELTLFELTMFAFAAAAMAEAQAKQFAMTLATIFEAA